MEENKKVFITAIVLICLVILGGSIYYFFIRGKSKEPAGSSMITSETLPGEEDLSKDTKLPEALPIQLDKSDNSVRSLVKQLSSSPELARWLATHDIIRKFTAAVDNIANGQSPRPQVDFFKPYEKFKILQRGGIYYLDPDSFRRYNVVADVFDSLDTQGTVKLYWQLKPAIQQAYSELGYPKEDFTNTLTKAIVDLLKVPVIEEKIRLEKEVITFKLADPELENMSQAQKHLLRMGPANVSLIQAKLRDLAKAGNFR